VCANLTADVLIEILPTLVGASCGRLILSGILETQTEPVLARMGELGIDEYAITSEGEWVAVVI
jgi:ribosomal protein L11 methylase PrmA